MQMDDRSIVKHHAAPVSLSRIVNSQRVQIKEKEVICWFVFSCNDGYTHQ